VTKTAHQGGIAHINAKEIEKTLLNFSHSETPIEKCHFEN